MKNFCVEFSSTTQHPPPPPTHTRPHTHTHTHTHTYTPTLKLVSAFFYQIFIFSANDSPSKTVKNQFFVIFPLPFHTFQIQKNKWKWNNLRCHELACINLQKVGLIINN